MRRIVWYTIVVLLTLGGVILLWQFRGALVLFLLSLATAAAFRPVITRLDQRGIPHAFSIVLAYVMGLGLVLLLLYLASGPLLADLQQVTNDFAAAYTTFKANAANGPSFEKSLAGQLPPLDQLYKGIASNQGTALATTVLGVATNLADLISQFFIVVVLSIYWSIDAVHFERLWLSLLPGIHRARARDIWREIEYGVGGYVRSEVLQSLMVGLLLGAAYRIIGLPYPTLLALLGALAWLIPWLGAVLALIAPFVVGLEINLQTGVLAAVVTLLVLGLLEVFVEPRLFDRRRYSALLIILMVVALSDVYGLAGLLIAPPLAAAIQIFFEHLLAPSPPTPAPVPVAVQESGPSELPSNQPEQLSPEERIAELRAQLSRLQEMSAGMEETPEVANLISRLNGLLDEAEAALKKEGRLTETSP